MLMERTSMLFLRPAMSFPVNMPQNPSRLRFADNVLQAETRWNGDWMAFSDQDYVCFPEELLLVSEGMENTHAHMVQAAAKPQER
jgi:hypothetical protein